MKTLLTWASAHPVWATIIVVGIIVLIALIVKAINNNNEDEAPAEPVNTPPATRAGSLLLFPQATINTGSPSGMGGSDLGGAGFGGGRMGSAKS